MMCGFAVVAFNVLALCVLMMIIVWIYRYIQFRKALQQSKWRMFSHQTNISTGSSYIQNSEDSHRPFDDVEIEWPSSTTLYLSPIPEGIEGRVRFFFICI
jgi:hypothetical protein